MAEHILRISQHRKVHGSCIADNWKSITFAVKHNTHLRCSEQLISGHPLNSYRLMQDTSDLLCMLLISFLISKCLQTLQNAKSSSLAILPTAKSPVPHPANRVLQPLGISTLVYSWARVDVLVSFWRNMFQTLAHSLFQLLSRWCNTW